MCSAEWRAVALAGGCSPGWDYEKGVKLRALSWVIRAGSFALPFASTPVWVYAAPTRCPYSLTGPAWFVCRVVLVISRAKGWSVSQL